MKAREARQEGRYDTALSHEVAPRKLTQSVRRCVFGRPFGPQGGIIPPLPLNALPPPRPPAITHRDELWLSR